MRIIALATLREFWKLHADAETPLRSWYAEASRAGWRSPADVKAAYRNASLIANNRIVFNVKGNDYRLKPGNDVHPVCRHAPRVRQDRRPHDLR